MDLTKSTGVDDLGGPRWPFREEPLFGSRLSKPGMVERHFPRLGDRLSLRLYRDVRVVAIRFAVCGLGPLRDIRPERMHDRMSQAYETLEQLREGNRRFVAGIQSGRQGIDPSQRAALATGQNPSAIILGCADSRVPAEFVFDQGLGDLFVIRVAGNIVAPSQIGSVEFAADRFGTRLVVVLGHTQCGAIGATVEELEDPGCQLSNLRSIVDRIRPAVEPLMQGELRHDHAALIQHAGRANIASSVDQLRHGSELLMKLIREDALVIIGAEYCIETGVVDFFDDA
jgi:carbonic anhydrase